MTKPFSIGEVAARVEEVLGKMDSRQAAEVLRERVGYETSYETVRRARKGLGKTIAHDLLGAIAEAFNVPIAWLLLGDGMREPTGKPAEDGIPDGRVPPTYRQLFEKMEGVLADTSTPGRIRVYLLDAVVGGMRIAGLLEEGEIARARIRSLDGERDVARERQSILDRAEEAARERERERRASPEALELTGLSEDELRDLLEMQGLPPGAARRMAQEIADIRRRRDSAG